MIIYHICPVRDWQDALARGEYRAASLSAEGFIHCSTREQVAGSAARFFAGHTDLALLVIDRACVVAPVRDDAIGDGRLFPHIYGPLNLDAVQEARPYAPAPNGAFAPPK